MINGQTKLMGVIGWPVSHSFSPAMHNAAAAALGLDWVYVAMPVRPLALATAVAGLAAVGFQGFNITVPHKQAVMPLLDGIEPGAQAIGAVNTVVISQPENAAQPPRLIGYNTDWAGFLADLAALQVSVAGRDCLLLGAGGSARAVAYGLASAGGRVQVLARRPAQAAALVADLRPHLPDGALRADEWEALTAVAAHSHAPLIVNTTPQGMTPHSHTSPWPDDLPFPAGAFVYDLVYNPPDTRLMQQARAVGCQVANGLGMLVRQGAIAFKLWTGHEPDVEVMAGALKGSR